MSREPRSVETPVGLVDPVPEAARPPELDARSRADLAGILSTRPAGVTGRPVAAFRARRSLRLALPAGAVIAAAVAIALTANGPGGGSAYAATPEPLAYQQVQGSRDAHELLTRLASHTATLPDDIGSGRYAHELSRSWSLFTTVDGERVTSVVVPQVQETWAGDDGSGKVITAVERPGQAVQRSEQFAGPGELTPPRSHFSQDDAELAIQLEQGHPKENGPAERLVAIQDAYRQVPLSPGVRAAMLRYLAATPGLQVTGDVTDRAGRSGLAVSLDSDYDGLPTRYTMILAPESGHLLASEETLTVRAGALNVPVPSVIGYYVYLSAGYTDRLG